MEKNFKSKNLADVSTPPFPTLPTTSLTKLRQFLLAHNNIHCDRFTTPLKFSSTKSGPYYKFLLGDGRR